MAHESFENKDIANFLNEHFICIKVDREERPDIDSLYMAATVALTGSGGWPMSVFLMPDGKPFFAGTYFPPKSVQGRPGFRDLLEKINKIWQQDRDKIEDSAKHITETLVKENSVLSQKGDVGEQIIHQGFNQAAASYDPVYGGFGKAPKFPRPTMYHQLLRYYYRNNTVQAKDMVLFSLQKMATGGMYDILGGGFHRYSVDGQWRVPHFEKMLYDQAGLALIYSEAYQVSGDPFYLNITMEILDYVLRDMTHAEGGFYSAEDADSTSKDDKKIHSEGLFYIWDYDEISELLGDDATIFNAVYGVRVGGNALHDPLGEFYYKNIFFQELSFADAAEKLNITEDDVKKICAKSIQTLFTAREKRPRPHLDDKIITAWNGLMISAFSTGYKVTGDEKYRNAAMKCAEFIKTNLMDDQFVLLRRYRDGEARFNGQLEDYAFYIQGLIDLYETTFDVTWLQLAVDLQDKQNKLFADWAGGYFDTNGEDRSIFLRLKNDYDGAEPSGNSVSAMNLLLLGQYTNNADYTTRATDLFAVFSEGLNHSPLGRPNLVSALDFASSKPMQIIIVGEPEQKESQALLAVINKMYLPNTITIMASAESRTFFEPKMATFEYLVQLNGKATAYLCENYTCQKPVTTPTELEKLLQQK
jgi:uncharacterized protein YyaL (SSP411 family)